MKFTKHILPLLLAIVMLSTSLVGCDRNDSGDAETTDAAETKTTDEGENALYTLTFTSNGDGTCYVSHIDFQENADDREITLVFPEKSPEGDTVTAIRYTTGDNLPRIISDTDFRKNIIAPLLEQMEVRPRLEELGLIQPGQDLAELDLETVPSDIFMTDNAAFPFQFKQLLAWYGGQQGKKSLASQATDELKQALISHYSFLEEDPDAEFWALDSSISQINLIKLGGTMSLISYAPVDATRDEGTWHDAHHETVNYCRNIVAMSFPDTLTDLDSSIFRNCTSLRAVQIPEQVTELCDYAFAGYSQLTSLDIPSSVTSIGNGAFYDCTSLTSITIPDSVTYIGDMAFDGTPWFNALCEDESNWADDMLYVGHALLDCKTDKVGVASVKAGTTCIVGNAFNGCSKLTSVELPDSVTSIGEEAFSGCHSLTSITIPDGVTGIGGRAFCNCFALTSITIPESLTSIGDEAFANCYGLTSITFGGTQEQWNAISKGMNWEQEVAFYTIHCTDGDISK